MVCFLSTLCWEAKVSKQIVVWHNLDVSLPIWPCVKYYRIQSASVPTRCYKIAMQIRFGILPLLVNKNAKGFKTEQKSSTGEKLKVNILLWSKAPETQKETMDSGSPQLMTVIECAILIICHGSHKADHHVTTLNFMTFFVVVINWIQKSLRKPIVYYGAFSPQKLDINTVFLGGNVIHGHVTTEYWKQLWI